MQRNHQQQPSTIFYDHYTTTTTTTTATTVTTITANSRFLWYPLPETNIISNVIINSNRQPSSCWPVYDDLHKYNWHNHIHCNKNRNCNLRSRVIQTSAPSETNTAINIIINNNRQAFTGLAQSQPTQPQLLPAPHPPQEELSSSQPVLRPPSPPPPPSETNAITNLVNRPPFMYDRNHYYYKLNRPSPPQPAPPHLNTSTTSPPFHCYAPHHHDTPSLIISTAPPSAIKNGPLSA